MSNIKNPWAFPRPHSECTETKATLEMKAQQGMTLRDYFAGQALQGIIVGAHMSGKITEDMQKAAAALNLTVPAFLAKCAYEQACAMLAERAQHESHE